MDRQSRLRSAASVSWILHLSDPHLGDVSPGQSLTDEKVVIQGQRDLETTQTVFTRTLARLRSYVDEHGRPDAVAVSGDLTYRSRASGFDAFIKLLANSKDVFPEQTRIVVVPGNHDVVWDELPGKPARYTGFLRATREHGCATPIIDGLDFNVDTAKLKPVATKHPHVVETDDFLIVPINSSNFCGTFVDLRDRWTKQQWERKLKPLGPALKEALEQLDFLRQHDMARVSLAQIEALGALFDKLHLSRTRDDNRVRVAVIHHQLLPLSTREERKSFESLVNLGLIRQTLREYEFDVVLHGHKHEQALYWDFVRRDSDPIDEPARRVLVIASPGDFDVGQPTMRALHLEGNPRARNLRIVTFEGSAPQTRKARFDAGLVVPLWRGPMEVESKERSLVRGASSSSAYGRVRALFEQDGRREMRNLVCQIDDPKGTDELPADYPVGIGDDRNAWFRDLVEWWQLDRSELVDRRILLFNHGERIYRRFDDQVDRAIRVLDQRASSSRAIIALIDPRETGRYERDSRELETGSYPAFALAEFGLVSRAGRRELDCFGYFRKQEMQYWWAINVAELALLQAKVCAGMRRAPRAGRIVTFSAIALWKETLPRVAVPELDRLVDSPSRLAAMAAAVVFPGKGGDEGRRDWGRVLAELGGKGRDKPPRPTLGHIRLKAEIERFRALSDSSTAKTVSKRLDELCHRYEALEGQDLNAAGVTMIRQSVNKLRASVEAALAAGG